MEGFNDLVFVIFLNVHFYSFGFAILKYLLQRKEREREMIFSLYSGENTMIFAVSGMENDNLVGRKKNTGFLSFFFFFFAP